ncbi:MAG: GNAT family N-acetyltransferase [Acidimicrobiia bacterium]
MSDYPDLREPARGLLEEYLRLPDIWQDHGGVPERLPERFEREIEAFPGPAAPPAGDVVIGLGPGGDAVAAGHIVGSETGTCELKRVYVRPAGRRQGAGTQLARAMIERARSLGYRRAVLDVMPSRTGAVALWHLLGFRDCAPYRTYSFPMTAMALDLDPGPE